MNYSLIIPHYNNPILLSRLLSTVPKRRDMQVIVVDDCSTEKKEDLEIIRNNYNWIEWYDTETNGGGGKARNVGLSHAVGKYVIFADSDDCFVQDFDKLLDKYSNTDFDVIYFNIDSENGVNNSVRISRYRTLYEKALREEEEGINGIRFNFLCPWAKFISLELLLTNNIRFSETSIHNDALFSAKTGVFAKRYLLDSSVLYILSEQPLSVSKIINEDKLVTRYLVFNGVNKLYKAHQLKMFQIMEYYALISLLRKLQLTKIARSVSKSSPNVGGFGFIVKILINKIKKHFTPSPK